MAKQEVYGQTFGCISGQTDTIRYVHGDLFGCPSTDSLAHCISADCRMGAGIAVQFKKRFKRVEEIKQQNKKKGDVAALEAGGKYIYYLITKDRASGKPTYEDLRKSLEAMKDHALCNRVTAISMPRIGCGLDRLQWNNVSSILNDVFRDTGIVITVYSM